VTTLGMKVVFRLEWLCRSYECRLLYGYWELSAGSGYVLCVTVVEMGKSMTSLLLEWGEGGGGILKTEMEGLNQETVRRADRRQKRAK